MNPVPAYEPYIMEPFKFMTPGISSPLGMLGMNPVDATGNAVQVVNADLVNKFFTYPGGWKNLHIDSWEMGAQNWTGAFREEFRNRRGYDLAKYLPVLTGAVVGSREISERFLWDLRETVQELILTNHANHFKTLGRRHGLHLSIEPYDMNPASDMSRGSIADVPMCEFWLYGFNTSYSVIEATSIAHTAGRTVVAAESFT